MSNFLKIFSISFTILLFSCGSEVEPDNYEIPSTYSFTDADGNNTVNYSGQIARFNQLTELTNYMKTANTPGVSVDEAQLLDMYSNNSGSGSSFFSDEANAEGKQLKNKTARGDANYIGVFENYFKELASVSANTISGEFNASLGQSGVLKSGEKQYLVNENGLEYVQIIEKGLMGAVFYDQIQNVYLGNEKMEVDNSTPEDSDNGKYYTEMEHHWDEAYGYFTNSTDYPTSGTDKFWGKYSNTVDPYLNTNETIALAFRTGRAAISNNDMETRDEQISILRTELEKVCAGTAIHYLNSGASNFNDDALRTHALSEAAAFLEGLYFTYSNTKLVSSQKVTELLNYLKNEDGNYDFYNITIQDINTARDELSSIMGFDEFKTEL